MVEIKKDKLITVFVIMTVLVLIFGTLLHFVYELSGENPIVGLFTPVNESAWEHLKLAYFPMLFFGLVSFKFIKDVSNNFIEGLTLGIVSSMLFIVVFFYGYQLLLGSDYFVLDILDFIFGIIIGEFVFFKIVSLHDFSNVYSLITCFIVLLGLLICFMCFTYNPPDFFIFDNPLN